MASYKRFKKDSKQLNGILENKNTLLLGEWSGNRFIISEINLTNKKRKLIVLHGSNYQIFPNGDKILSITSIYKVIDIISGKTIASMKSISLEDSLLILDNNRVFILSPDEEKENLYYRIWYLHNKRLSDKIKINGKYPTTRNIFLINKSIIVIITAVSMILIDLERNEQKILELHGDAMLANHPHQSSTGSILLHGYNKLLIYTIYNVNNVKIDKITRPTSQNISSFDIINDNVIIFESGNELYLFDTGRYEYIGKSDSRSSISSVLYDIDNMIAITRNRKKDKVIIYSMRTLKVVSEFYVSIMDTIKSVKINGLPLKRTIYYLLSGHVSRNIINTVSNFIS